MQVVRPPHDDDGHEPLLTDRREIVLRCSQGTPRCASDPKLFPAQANDEPEHRPASRLSTCWHLEVKVRVLYVIHGLRDLDCETVVAAEAREIVLLAAHQPHVVVVIVAEQVLADSASMSRGGRLAVRVHFPLVGGSGDPRRKGSRREKRDV